MELLTIKLLAALGIIAITVIGGAIPLLAARREVGRRFFSLGNAFAGGIFLGVGFIHLLPEGMEELGEVVDFPLGALLAVVGVGVLLLIDRVIFGHHHRHGVAGVGQPEHRSFYPYVLLAALSIHAVTAGVALGLETAVSTTVVIMLGILFHKGSESFALMVCAHTAGLETKRQKNILAILVLMTPLGVLFGLTATAGLGETSTAKTLIEGGFIAFAAGTFIYVAILDIIHEELSRGGARPAESIMSTLPGQGDASIRPAHDDRAAKFLLIVAGIALMAIIPFFVHHH